VAPSNAHRPATVSTKQRLGAAAAACVWLLMAGAARAQDACASDADCDEQLVCMRVLFGVDCDDAGCLQVQEQGFCSEPSPEALRCDDSDACPAPLYCDVDNLNGPLCAFDQPLCGSSDDACPAGFSCVDLEPLGGCELCEDTDDGIACTPAPCAENMLNLCSPLAMACEDDADCAEGFVCGEVGPFDLQTGWDEALVGTRACLSIGLLAVTDGVVQGGQDVPPDGGVGVPPIGGEGGSGGQSAGTGGSAGSGGASGSAGSAGTGGAAGEAGAGAPPASSKGDGGGCSVRDVNPSRGLALTVLLALLIGALLLRRWPVG